MGDDIVDGSDIVSPTVHKADLTSGMEHMRAYVSVESTHSPVPFNRKGVDVSDSTYGVPSNIINPPRHTQQPTENAQKRTDPFQFGTRLLKEEDDIFEFNAWDHVEVDKQFKEFAQQQFQRQREAPVSDFDRERFNKAPAKFWDSFYKNNKTNFFKDRKWLFQEFPSLKEATEASTPVTILEVGAGAGNTAFPVLKQNKNPHLKIHACDYAPNAVKLMRESAEFDPQYMSANVWDVSGVAEDGQSPLLPPEVEPHSVDIVVLIFIMSALQPQQWEQALTNISHVLKPGGEILFRDYGRGDLAQVRFKSGRWLEENFYVRGDGTRVYFFEQDQLKDLFMGTKEGPQFEVLNLGTDRRMLVNRQRRLKMYRCWMQGRFRKPVRGSEG